MNESYKLIDTKSTIIMDPKLKPDFDKMSPEIRKMYEWLEEECKWWEEFCRGDKK